MVFSSIPFLLYYLPLLLAVYFTVPGRYRRGRNAVLTLASLLFYAWGEGLTVLLLMTSIVINHCLAQSVQQSRFNVDRRFVLALGVSLNLAFLAWYKYAGFLASIVGYANWQAPALPLGISFFTFQAISYLIDVYRKEAEPAKSVLTSALYISSFPQLIAGPIVRYKAVAQQIVDRKESFDLFALGIQAFVIGLAQKVLLANTVGQVADAAFNAPAQTLSVLGAWVGLIAYSLQIFFDFAGYSNMAIGLGFMLGFRFPKNFDTPYAAQSVTEFWRRWHMTLSEWFRDYLYIGLGGNRHGTLRTILNLWIVFLLCGLWHGASWTFLVWGAWHGFFLSLERLWLGDLLKRAWRPLRHLYLMLAVFLGWVLFRAEDIHQAFDYYRILFGVDGQVITGVSFVHSSNVFVVMLIAYLLSTGLPKQSLQSILEKAPNNVRTALSLSYANGLHWLLLGMLLVLCTAVLMGTAYNPFIYFRF